MVDVIITKWNDLLVEVSKKAGLHYTKYGQGTAGVLGFLVGAVFTLGLALAFICEEYYPFGWYLIFLSIFHMSEFVLASLFRPKELSADLVGILITTLGSVIRILAQYHARSSFNHIVQDKKSDDHVLVTNGVFQHPSYFGWFWYTIGTQIILGNPICLIGFGAAAYFFFADRIPEEEKYLRSFFPDYAEYAAKTPIYIPGIWK